MTRLAIGALVIGLLIAGYFLHLGPAVSTTPRALAWSSGPLDAGGLDVQFALGGVDFIRARDLTDAELPVAMLRRGGQHLVLTETNDFHLAAQLEGRLWAISESTTEGPGPSLDLLVSPDDGQNFEVRASLPKPNYAARFEGFTVKGDELTVVLSLDDETPISDQWLWPWWALDFAAVSHPTIGPGRFALRSKNGGRSWRLER